MGWGVPLPGSGGRGGVTSPQEAVDEKGSAELARPTSHVGRDASHLLLQILVPPVHHDPGGEARVGQGTAFTNGGAPGVESSCVRRLLRRRRSRVHCGHHGSG